MRETEREINKNKGDFGMFDRGIESTGEEKRN